MFVLPPALPADGAISHSLFSSANPLITCDARKNRAAPCPSRGHREASQQCSSRLYVRVVRQIGCLQSKQPLAGHLNGRREKRKCYKNTWRSVFLLKFSRFFEVKDEPCVQWGQVLDATVTNDFPPSWRSLAVLPSHPSPAICFSIPAALHNPEFQSSEPQQRRAGLRPAGSQREQVSFGTPMSGQLINHAYFAS